MNRLSLIILFLIFHWKVFAQFYDLKPIGNFVKDCKECQVTLSLFPPEVRYTIIRQGDEIFFVMSDKVFYQELFKEAKDGIAVDIIKRSQFDCKAPPVVQSPQYLVKGTLLPPMYKKDMEKNAVTLPKGGVLIKYGQVPKEFKDQEIELNLILIDDKRSCFYANFYDIKSYKWELLDMGLYMDTLVSDKTFDSLAVNKVYTKEHTEHLTKNFKFTVNFKKNEYEYKPEDVKHIHDSLNYTDYYIKKITIRAYSSVEGATSVNEEIQRKRSESIIAALQSYQKPEIQNEIIVSENWVEFLEDITKTPYNYLSSLSKTEVKERLKDKVLQERMETILQKHRKAVIQVELGKTNVYKTTSADDLILLFNKAVKDKNLKKALEIQDALFEKIQDREFPAEVLNRLEIPKQTDYSPLLNNNTIFKYKSSLYDLTTAYKDLETLETLFPKDSKIKYNKCVLKFKIWISVPDNQITPAEINNDINGLVKYNIHPMLIKKLQINYNIIMSENYMYERQYALKDKCLQFIAQNYKQVKLSNTDLINISQYFVSYVREDMAIQLLAPYINKIDVDEDLLFYYLNLTIINPKMTRDFGYKKTMLNALNFNKQRFCTLFHTYGKGGITFQLLENAILKKIYCENCEK